MSEIKATLYDTKVYQTIHSKSKALKDVATKGLKEDQKFDELSQDIFCSFFKTKPRMHDHVNNPLHRDILKRLHDSQEYRSMHEHTKWEEVVSAFATADVATDILNNLPKDLKDKNKEFQNKQEENEQRKQEREERKKERREKEKAGGKKPSKKVEQQEKKAEKLSEEKSKADMKQFKWEVEAHSKDINRAVEKAVKSNEEKVKATAIAIKSWGNEPGSHTNTMSIEERIELATKLKSNSMFRRISEAFGRLKMLFKKTKKATLKYGRDFLHSTEIGNNLNYVFPNEFALLFNKRLKRSFYVKYAEHRLNQYRVMGKHFVGKGPIVALLDISGSMWGDAEVAGKALVLALGEVCLEEKRDCHIVVFESTVRGEYTLPIKDFRASRNMLFNIASISPDGGTSFMVPLKKGIEFVKAKKLENQKWNKADIVMITDGYCSMTDVFKREFNLLKKATGTRLQTLIIGGSAQSFESIADSCFLFSSGSDLLNKLDNASEEVFKDILSEPVEKGTRV